MSIKIKVAQVTFGNIVPMIAAAISTPIIINGAGKDTFAVLSIIWMMIGFISFLELGVGAALTHKISILLKSDAIQDIEKTITAGVLITGFTGMVSGLLLWHSSEFIINNWLNVNASMTAAATLSLKVAAIALPLTTISACIRGTLEGYQDFKHSAAIRATFGATLYLLPSLFASSNTKSLLYMVISLVATRALMLLAYMLVLFQKYNYKFKFKEATSDEYKKLLKFGSWMAIANIATQLIPAAERIIIANNTNLISVAYYSAAYDTLVRFMIFPASIATVLFPIISGKYINKRAESKKIATNLTFQILLAGLIVFGPILVFSEPLLSTWIDKDFAKNSYYIFQILAVGFIFSAAAHIPLVEIQAAGRVKSIAYFYLIQTVCYLSIFTLIIKDYGLLGATIVSLIRSIIDFLSLLLISKMKNK